MEIKVSDLGLAIDVYEERPVTRAGTLDYMVGGGRRDRHESRVTNRGYEIRDRCVRGQAGHQSWSTGLHGGLGAGVDRHARRS